MKPFPHTYAVRIAATATGHATLTGSGVEPLPTAAPVEFDGPGDAWSPEQLLLAAAASCYLLTFRAVAKHTRVDFTALSIDVEGVVDHTDGRTRFTEIVLRPTLTLAPGADTRRVRQAFEKAETNCIVTASLATPIRVEPELAA